MNNIDITKTGYLTGDQIKDLNEQLYLDNQELLKQYQDLLWFLRRQEELKKWLNPARAIYNESFTRTHKGDRSEDLIKAGFGDSKYDKNLTNFDELTNLNEVRALNLSRADKIANSIVNAAVVAGTTAVETYLGTAVGLLNAVGNLVAGNVKSTGDFINYTINNPLSDKLREIEKEFSDRFMNYKTAEYNNEEWYEHILSTDFIGDAFILTAGYAVGAMVGGVGVAKTMTKALKVAKTRDIFEGLALEAGQAGSKAKDVWKAYMQGKPINGMQVTESLAKAAENYADKTLATRITASIAGGFGEARPIALDSGELFYNENASLLKELARYDLSRIEEDIYLEHPEWFELVQAIPENLLSEDSNLLESHFRPILKEEYLDEYDKIYNLKSQLIETKYTNLLLELEKEKIKHENTTFSLVAGITTGLNTIQIGKAVAGGMSQQQGLKNVILNQNGLGFIADEAADKAALRAAKFKAFSSVASEMVEEGLQDIIPNASDIYFGNNMNDLRKENSFYSQGLYQKGINSSSDYLGDLVNSAIGTITNPEEWESAIVGGIFGFVPMGGVGRSTHINKEGKVEKGKLELRGEFWESLREAKQAKQGSKAAAEALNKVLLDPKYKDYISAMIRHLYYADEMNSGLVNNDAKLFKDAEYKDFINTAMLFAEYGQLDYFKRLIDRHYSIETELDVEELKLLLKSKDGDNLDFFKNKSSEEIIDYYKRTKEKMFKDLSSFEKIQENLSILYGDMPKEFRQELIFDIANIDNRELRIGELSKKLNEFTTKNTEYFENEGVEVSKLKESITDSKLGEIISFFEQLNPEIVSELFEGTTTLSERVNKEKSDKIKNSILREVNHKEQYDKNTKNLEDEIITLKDKLTEIQKVKNKKLAEKYLGDKKLIEEKIKDLLETVKARKKYSEEFQNDIETLKESLENLKTQAIKSDVSSLDLKDLIRLVGERDLLLKKFKYLANNPKKFEDFLSEKLNKAINTFYKRRAEQYYSQLENDFDTNIILDNALKVETLILLAKEKDNKTLQAKLEAFAKYILILTHPKTLLDESNDDCNSLFDIIYHLLRTNNFQTVEEYDTYIKGYLKDLNKEIKDPETGQMFPNTVIIKRGNNNTPIRITVGILLFRDIFIVELDNFNNTDTVNKETQEGNVQDGSESLFDLGEAVGENEEFSDISENIDDDLLGEFFGSEESSDNTDTTKELEVEEIELVNTGEPKLAVSEPKIITTEESDTSEQSSDQNNQETTLEPTNEEVPQLELLVEPENPEEDIESTLLVEITNIEVSNLQPVESPVPLEVTTDSPINLNTTIYDIDALKRGKILEKSNLRITEKVLKSLGTFKLIDSGLLQQAFLKSPDMPVLPIKLGLIVKNNYKLLSTFFAVETSYFKDFNIPDSYNIKTVKVVSKDGEIKEVFVVGVLNEPITVVSKDNHYTDKKQSKRAKDIANLQFFTENEDLAINNIDNFVFPAYHQHDSLGNPIETRIEHVFSGRLQYTDKTYPLKNLVQEANEETVDIGYFKNGEFISIDNKVLKNNEIEVLPNDNNGNPYQRDGSVWIRVKESDGRYYFKPLYVNKFDFNYIQNSPKDSVVTTKIELLTQLIQQNLKKEKYKDAKKYSNLLEKLLLDLHIYKDNNNKFYINVKNGPRFVINDSSFKDFLLTILDLGYTVNITNKIFNDSKSLIDSNILDANVSSIHNVGASVLISPIYIENGVYRYLLTTIGKLLKEGKTIHLGNIDSDYQRLSKYSNDGSYRIIDGKYEKRQTLKLGTKWKEITSDKGKSLIDFIIAKDNNEIESTGFTFDNGVKIELFEYKNNYFTNSKNGVDPISKAMYIQYMLKIKLTLEAKLNGSEVSKINDELLNIENTFVSEIPVETILEPKLITVEVLANQDNTTETLTTPLTTQNILQTPQRVVRNTGTGGNAVMRLPKIANSVFNRYNITFERDEKMVYKSSISVKQKLIKLYESNSDVLYDLELMEDTEFKLKLKDLLNNTCI